ncbi:hypothetical protein [Cytobacillus horneckiae]|nr:hypothetical protein [Cytobacillus horneckiae]
MKRQRRQGVVKILIKATDNGQLKAAGKENRRVMKKRLAVS